METKWFESKMFKNIVFSVAGLLACFLVLAVIQKAHDTIKTYSDSPYPNKTISTVGQAKIKATPDLALFNFSYISQNDTPEALSKEAETATGSFKEFLIKQGVKEEDISPTQYSLSNYGYGVDTYQITSSFSAQLAVSEGMEETLKKIVTEAQNKKMLSYTYIGCLSFEDVSSKLKDGWDSALKDAHSKAENLTKLSGQKLGQLLSVGDNYYPTMQSGVKMAGAGYDGTCSGTLITPSVKIQPIELISSVSAMYQVK